MALYRVLYGESIYAYFGCEAEDKHIALLGVIGGGRGCVRVDSTLTAPLRWLPFKGQMAAGMTGWHGPKKAKKKQNMPKEGVHVLLESPGAE